MLMVRKIVPVLLLIFQSQQVFTGNDDDWPSCPPYTDDKGRPIGCKSSFYDVCSNQSEECRELVCGGNIKNAIRACKSACAGQTEPVKLEEGVYTCWCVQQREQTCVSEGAQLTQSGKGQYQKFADSIDSRSSEPTFWGTVQIPDEKLLPVFCDTTAGCGISYSLCVTGDCPANMCKFGNKCYYIAEYKESPEGSCEIGKPVAIDSNKEKIELSQLLGVLPIISGGSIKVATAGRVLPSETQITWVGWDTEPSGEFGPPDIQPEDFERILYFINGGGQWGLAEVFSNELALTLCEADVDEECDATTTTLEQTTQTTSTIDFIPTTSTTTEMTTTTATAPDTVETTTSSRSESTSTVETTTSPRSEGTSTVETTTEPANLTTEEDTTTSTTEDTTTETTTIENSCEDCVKIDQYGIRWSCCSGEICGNKCPLNAEGKAFWSCGGDKQFITAWPDYTDCTNTWINNLTTLIDEGKVTPFTLIMDLDQYVKDSSLFGHEIDTSLNFTMTSLEMLIRDQEEADDPPVTKLNQRKFISEMAIGVINKLLILAKPWEQLNQSEISELGMRMNSLAESFGFAVTEKAKSIGENYNMTAFKSHINMDSQFLIHKQGPGHIVRFPIEAISKKTSTIVIQKLPSMFRVDGTHIESVGQLIPAAFAEKLFPSKLNSMGDEKKKINSGMISMTLLGPDRKPIHDFDSDDAVLVTFKHNRQAKGPLYETIWHELYPGEKPTAIRDTERCAFWNASSGRGGEWDTRGCRKVNSSHWFTVCECNHLSSFALLMDVHQYIAKDKIMEIISIVFSSLSVISLTITLIVLHFLKGIQGERNSIGKHLCVCLLIGHLLALTVLDRSYFGLSQEVCIGVAVSLHYIFLAAFVWMAVEGHHLYRLVVRVFDSGRDLSKIYLCLGYGIPVLIVGITIAVTVSLNDHGYANDELCWLSSPDYIWAFMGPVLFLTLINLVVLVLAMRVAVTAGTQQKKSFMSRVKVWIKGWFSLSSLLGVTWIFGFFYIQFDHNFAYAFVTLNGLQGVFIFLTRVVFNEQVKTAMKRGAKQRAMMKRFYDLAWKGRSSGTSFQPSSWFFGASSTSSQLDLTSSGSTSYWNNTTSRRRSSANHSFSNDGDSPAIDNQLASQNISSFHPVLSGTQDISQPWFKKKISREEELEHSTLQNWNSGEIQHIWNNLREPDTLSEIPEEDYDDAYESMEGQKQKY